MDKKRSIRTEKEDKRIKPLPLALRQSRPSAEPKTEKHGEGEETSNKSARNFTIRTKTNEEQLKKKRDKNGQNRTQNDKHEGEKQISKNERNFTVKTNINEDKNGLQKRTKTDTKRTKRAKTNKKKKQAGKKPEHAEKNAPNEQNTEHRTDMDKKNEPNRQRPEQKDKSGQKQKYVQTNKKTLKSGGTANERARKAYRGLLWVVVDKITP